ncbi:LLM class flavin-dependent oxidoreductase [Calidifontibacter sp. DB0510]|uniref:LLM class flavin-dependent oxidoreductase n=1 Tax=Metallococcus carri TaxID=1656884 RepID=A0A967EA80_9MICO|nr:LLM class flavin-dependent oxidoreductase [Metallococcus carri]NHN57182.1 LLM class flavin-dependent oxidoreductase [Metallococcus carri]NOP38015.1 LLM class flavin-dependent oxidoreductase [Calidifontibacter sp. DB2511S]
MSGPFLGVALTAGGWHPQAWREDGARAQDFFTAGYWVDLVAEAERGVLDFVTFEDEFTLQSPYAGAPARRVDHVTGRLDAVLTAARVAPTARGIGLLPTATVAHTEPFQLSKAIATLDFVSGGRAGVRLRAGANATEARHFGRREFPDSPVGTADWRRAVAAAFTEVSDYAEVIRRLWDSWEDDAEIRDVATGRFVDRDKLHYIDFHSEHFSVRGPSITPRPPQGQPLVTVLAHQQDGFELIARSADLGLVTPRNPAQLGQIRAAIRAASPERTLPDPPIVVADVVVFLDGSEAAARARKERLDLLEGAEFGSDATVFTGSPTDLADLIEDWHAAGADGIRLRPATIPDDLTRIVEEVVPVLQQRGVRPSRYDGSSLRERFELTAAINRYAPA